jgi:hypothetical protein
LDCCFRGMVQSSHGQGAIESWSGYRRVVEEFEIPLAQEESGGFDFTISRE